MAGNGGAGEEVDEEEHVVLVGVRGWDAVDDIVVAVDAVVLECAAVGGGEQ